CHNRKPPHNNLPNYIMTYFTKFLKLNNYKSVSLYSASLKPRSTCWPASTNGRFINIPSDDKISSFSSSDISGSLFFKSSSLYFFPLELKNLLMSWSDFSTICFSVSLEGGCFTISYASKSTPFSSKNFLPFLHVVHLEYSEKVIIWYLHR